MPRAESPLLLGDSGLLASLFVLGPFLGKVKACVDQRVFHPRGVAHIHSHLTVIHLPQPTKPLPCHTHRLSPFLRKARGIEHDHGIPLSQLAAHLTNQLLDDRPMVPRRLAHKRLHAHALFIMPIGNRFGILAFQVGQQTGHIRLSVFPAFTAKQAPQKRLDKLPQPRQHSKEHPLRHFTTRKQLFLAYFKASFHRHSPFHEIQFTNHERAM